MKQDTPKKPTNEEINLADSSSMNGNETAADPQILEKMKIFLDVLLKEVEKDSASDGTDHTKQST